MLFTGASYTRSILSISCSSEEEWHVGWGPWDLCHLDIPLPTMTLTPGASSFTAGNMSGGEKKALYPQAVSE